MSHHGPVPFLVEQLETRWMFAIELDIVALHEFGHALGLAHYADTPANSIMEAYYNANYNKSNLATDVSVLTNGSDGYSNLLELFSDANIAANTTSWKDSLDGNQNGVVNVSYSFVPDNTKLENNKRSNLFSTIAPDVGGAAALQALFAEELVRWGNVSTGNLTFTLRSDNGANSGSGAAQNDPNFGDIRIGGHRFDGKGGVLAHCYYPPPNGGSFAGDAHFASEEDWSNGDPLTTDGVPVGRFARLVQTSEGLFFHCTFGEDHDHAHADALSASDAVVTENSAEIYVMSSASAASTSPVTTTDVRVSLPSERVDQLVSFERSSPVTQATGAESAWEAYSVQQGRAVALNTAGSETPTNRWSVRVGGDVR